MRWRQGAVATLLASGTAAILHRIGVATTLVQLLAVAGATYILVRVVIATAYRTEYWVRHSGEGRTCPGCGQFMHRLSGDWIPICKRCGWRAGWPGVRWVTQSVPARQFKRSLSLLRVAGLVVAAILIVGVPLPALAGGDGGVMASVGSTSDDHQVEATSAPVTPTETTRPGTHGYRLAQVEVAFIQLLNAERESRGLPPVQQRDELTAMGRAHSQNMATHEHLGHDEPGPGGTIEDRYRSRGLLPECRLPIQGTDRYYPGAENAAHFWVDQRIRQDDGSTLFVNDESDLARGLFTEWMNSPPHRRAMLVASADEAGLGIWIDDRGKVYASLELC